MYQCSKWRKNLKSSERSQSLFFQLLWIVYCKLLWLIYLCPFLGFSCCCIRCGIRLHIFLATCKCGFLWFFVSGVVHTFKFLEPTAVFCKIQYCNQDTFCIKLLTVAFSINSSHWISHVIFVHNCFFLSVKSL